MTAEHLRYPLHDAAKRGNIQFVQECLDNSVSLIFLFNLYFKIIRKFTVHFFLVLKFGKTRKERNLNKLQHKAEDSEISWFWFSSSRSLSDPESRHK